MTAAVRTRIIGGAYVASSSLAPLVGPAVERQQQRHELASEGRQGVGAAALLDDARVDELLEPLAEHARGDLAALDLPERARIVPQLPQHAQRPAATEQVEEGRDRALGMCFDFRSMT